MKRLLSTVIAVIAVIGLSSACTPEEQARLDAFVAWYHGQVDTAEAAGRPCPQFAADIAFRGLPPHFLDIIQRESRCDPTAINSSSGALGLTQVMPFWLRNLCPIDIACTPEQLLDPYVNLDAAAVIWAEQGPAAWTTW